MCGSSWLQIHIHCAFLGDHSPAPRSPRYQAASGPSGPRADVRTPGTFAALSLSGPSRPSRRFARIRTRARINTLTKFLNRCGQSGQSGQASGANSFRRPDLYQDVRTVWTARTPNAFNSADLRSGHFAAAIRVLPEPSSLRVVRTPLFEHVLFRDFGSARLPEFHIFPSPLDAIAPREKPGTYAITRPGTPHYSASRPAEHCPSVADVFEKNCDAWLAQALGASASHAKQSMGSRETRLRVIADKAERQML
ncbi:UNVERIFIED_ORG: hypothetical protein GGR78_003591 [Xanthomonas campestris]